MKPITKVRRATRLIAHLQDLVGLGKLTAAEFSILQESLFLLIEHREPGAPPILSHPNLIQPFPAKRYTLELSYDAPRRILVAEAGRPERRLRHMPIFWYGFDGTELGALDSALAILADFFGEDLSMHTFATGEVYAGLYYRALAKKMLSPPRSLRCIETKHLVTFLQREQRQAQAM